MGDLEDKSLVDESDKKRAYILSRNSENERVIEAKKILEEVGLGVVFIKDPYVPRRDGVEARYSGRSYGGLEQIKRLAENYKIQEQH